MEIVRQLSPSTRLSDQRQRVTPITRNVPNSQRPFAPAVAAQPDRRREHRALVVWEQFIVRMIECVTTTWHNGTSVDLLDGEVLLVATVGHPTVEVHTDAPTTTPDPMHLRGAIHLIENLRPSIRSEADVDIRHLDAIVAAELFDAVDRYPHTLARPGDVEALERLRHRYHPPAHQLQATG